MRPMNEMSEPVSINRKSKTPNCGACGPTAMPIMIRKGTLDKPSLAARATANEIRANARPISRITLSIGSPCSSFYQQTFDGINRVSVTRQDKRRSFVEHGIGFRVGTLCLIGFHDRND